MYILREYGYTVCTDVNVSVHAHVKVIILAGTKFSGFFSNPLKVLN